MQRLHFPMLYSGRIFRRAPPEFGFAAGFGLPPENVTPKIFAGSGHRGINPLPAASGKRDGLSLRETSSKFGAAVLEQLDAAHNLARWLMRNEQDAQDVVQEACMKALRSFDTFRGGDFRAWFLTIVRHVSFSALRRNKVYSAHGGGQSLEAGEEIAADGQVYDPQVIALRAGDAELVRRAIDALPESLREVLVLREMEQLSYKEIGKIAGVPIGTVMSRLARGRMQLQTLLVQMDQPPPRTPAREGAQ